MINLNKDNFPHTFQAMLEKYYLQPMDGSEKTNLKDGSIERTIHGAEHASRATLWALLMNNHLQKIAPIYTSSALEKIAVHCGASVEEVLLLMLMTMGCHDAARKGEGRDVWEAQSALVVLEVLKDLGLKEEHAKLFSAAVEFKDDSRAYENQLFILGVRSVSEFDYIRKIINLGDNLDIMRCVSHFNFKNIFDTLNKIPGFKEEHHDGILNLIQEIHQFIHDQNDMLFSCTLKDLRANDVVTLQSSFSKTKKVKYEHAGNVFAAIFANALKNPKFAGLITCLSLPETQLYEGEPAFDLFVHGTNTSILATLPKTKFTVMSPLEMMDTYQTAPMTGELTCGGYDAVGKPMRDTSMGKTSFGIMSSKGSYSLERIQSSYTALKVGSDKLSLDAFKKAALNGLDGAFSNINLLLIYLTQSRQTHDCLDDVIHGEELKTLKTSLDATTQFYYFMQLLGTHIHPDFKAIESSDISNILPKMVHTFLTFRGVVDKIISNKIDMKAIVENPSPENLHRALLVLQFPEEHTFNSGLKDECKIKLSTTQFFCLESTEAPGAGLYKPHDPEYRFGNLAKNISGYRINDLLVSFSQRRLSTSYFLTLGKLAKQHLEAFQERVAIFEKLVEAPQSQFTFTPMQSYFLEKKYPLILCVENEEKIQLHNFSDEEYRSKEALSFGKDIKIIATDTPSHRLEILKYLEVHGIKTVQVVLFDDLSKSKQTRERPSTEKWLCAKEVSKNEHAFFRGALLKTKPAHGDENIKAVEMLLEDARLYQSIDFPK